MKTMIFAFSLVAAVGIYFPASQLMATEPGQPMETTQVLDEPSAANEVALEQDADLTEGQTVSEEQMIREEAVAIDELIDQALSDHPAMLVAANNVAAASSLLIHLGVCPSCKCWKCIQNKTIN